MMRNLRLILVCALSTMLFGIQANAQPRVVGSAGGVDAIFTPDANQIGGFEAGVLSLHVAEGSTIVTFENISMSNLVQVGAPGFGFKIGTVEL